MFEIEIYSISAKSGIIAILLLSHTARFDIFDSFSSFNENAAVCRTTQPRKLTRQEENGTKLFLDVETPQGHAMKTIVIRFLKDQSGATAIEYGLIAAGIAVAIITVVQGLGTKLKATFKSVSDNLGSAP